MDDLRENPTSVTPAKIPPPPPQVRVRTMRSDITAITSGSGSLAGAVTTMEVPSTSSVQGDIINTEIIRETPEAAIKNFNPQLIIILGSVGATIILGLLIYYFIYPRFFGDTQNNYVPTDNTNVPAVPVVPAPPVTVTPPATSAFEHSSYFRVPAELLDIKINTGPAETAEDLQGYGQRLTNLISSSVSKNDFFEINTKDENGKSMSVAKFLGFINALVINNKILSDNFAEDFTNFVYRDKNGLWPGYALRLKKGTAIAMQNEIKNQIEKSPDLINLFLSSPGSFVNIAFKDKKVSEKNVRYITFDSGAEFSYSWFNSNTLVLSTSEAGLVKAFEHLGR